MKTSSRKKKEKGFSMVEALVAITILITSIVGPMTLAQRGLVTANTARDQVTAFFLGQEAVEYIRYVRDSNVLNGSLSWMTGLDQCKGAVCQVDSLTDAIVPCAGPGQCANLNRHDTNGFYGYTSGSNWKVTSFNREFTITEINSTEIAIDVIVSWKLGGLTKSLTIHENLFNWQ